MVISVILSSILAFFVGVFFGFWAMEQNFLSKAKKLLLVSSKEELVDKQVMVGICSALNVLFDDKLADNAKLAIVEQIVRENKKSETTNNT